MIKQAILIALDLSFGILLLSNRVTVIVKVFGLVCCIYSSLMCLDWLAATSRRTSGLHTGERPQQCTECGYQYTAMAPACGSTSKVVVQVAVALALIALPCPAMWCSIPLCVAVLPSLSCKNIHTKKMKILHSAFI